MEHSRLGNDGPLVSVIGLGTWAFGGDGWEYGWGPQDDQSSIRTMHRALDLGINLIDTADVYGLGRSEMVVGQALEGIRDQVFVATKGGMEWDDAGAIRRNSRYEYLMGAVEASLRRLKTDYIDLYQIHWPDPSVPIGDAARALDDMIRSGKVRYAGASNYSVEQLQSWTEVRPLTSLQPPYSMLERESEQELLPFCQRRGIGVLAYGPMAHGLLTGKFTETLDLAPDDMRWKKAHFQPETLRRNLGIVDRLRSLSADLGRSLAQLAIAWVLQHPAVDVALVGARRPDQIEETVGGAGWPLPDDKMARIEEILAITE